MVADATAVIAAAGSGQRLGAGGPKAFVELAGRPLLGYCLTAAAAAGTIGAIVVAAPAADLARARALADSLELGVAVEVTKGGATRAESVRAALELVKTEIAVIQDAARPLARPETFDRLVGLLGARSDAAGAIAAAPVADTVKRGRVDPSGISEIDATVPREDLWLAQTPQAFRRTALAAAQDAAKADASLPAATDESSLVERAGGRVLIAPVGYPNLKITVPEDLQTAAALLGRLGRV